MIDQQLNDYPDADIQATQEKLNAAYDAFSAKYGLLNDRKETTPREMKDQIIKLLDDWKGQQKEHEKPEKKNEQEK